MEPRLRIAELAKDGYQGMLAVERFLHSSALPSTVLELVKLRWNTINVTLHTPAGLYRPARSTATG